MAMPPREVPIRLSLPETDDERLATLDGAAHDAGHGRSVLHMHRGPVGRPDHLRFSHAEEVLPVLGDVCNRPMGI